MFKKGLLVLLEGHISGNGLDPRPVGVQIHCSVDKAAFREACAWIFPERQRKIRESPGRCLFPGLQRKLIVAFGVVSATCSAVSVTMMVCTEYSLSVRWGEAFQSMCL